jgi:hypothetical protein
MGGKNAPKVYDFLMSIHYGLCHGPVDQLNKVWVKDKSVMCGNYDERTDVPIQQPELFGGDDGEGGCVGVIEYYPGADDQVSSEALAARPGRTPATMPGYRGIASLFFRGFGNNGFRWTSNNPYLPGVKASVSRFPVTLGTANSKIYPVQEVVEEPVDPQIPSLGTLFEPLSSRDGFEGVVFPDEFDQDWAAPPLTAVAQGATSTRPSLDWTVSGAGVAYDAQYDWVADSGTLSFNLFRDILLSDLGITPAHIDDGEVEVRVNGIMFPDQMAGGSQTGSVTLASYDAADVATPGWGVSSALGTESVPVTAGEGPVPFSAVATMQPGDRALRVQIFSQGGIAVRVESLEVHWKEPEVVFCDPDNEGLRLLPNANPAHIIHETLVDGEWGKGEDPTRIDTATFTAAAQTFADEFFGLAFTWVRQGSVEDFIQQVLDHTRSMLFVHPRTGLWTLRPLRGDYDAAAVLAGRRLDPSNCVAKKRKRRAWGETVNEVVVKYTDPQTEEEASVAAHNLANIAIQGGVISETRPYPGIRDEWLAQFVADRDVTEAGHPLYSAEIETDRTFWDVVPGDVLAYSWPEDGITDMIVRVMKVDYGSPTDRKVKLSVVEDVFALEQTAYGPVQNSEWVSTRALPEPLDAEMVMAAPLALLSRSGYDVADVDANYPTVGVMLLGTDDDNQAIDVAVSGLVTRTDGSQTTDIITRVPAVPTAVLESALAEESSSTLTGTFVATLTLGSAEQGDLLLIGGGEANQEIVVLGPYDTNADTWTVWRGIYDTVPTAWPAGTRVWVLPEFDGQNDPNERAAGETITYRLLPRMSEGRLAEANATAISYTATERPHLPLRPANVQIDGNGFALADFTSGATFPISVTWANRNRTTEDQVALRWTQANVTPEAGQTTVIRVFDDTDALAGEITGLTGTSHDMTSGNFFGVTYGYLEFVSERDGLRSRPGARRWFDMRQGGYGQNYGQSYG